MYSHKEQLVEPQPQPPHPSAAGSPRPLASEEEFKAALARLTGGVTLITAFDPDDGPRGEDVGMTATAFLSVSLEPPMVLVSVRRDSRMEDVLDRQPRWAASVLSDSQRHVAGRFALKGRISDRLLFEDIAYYRGGFSGAPLPGGALAVVECETVQRVEAGDHVLFIGEVRYAATPSADGRPLAYFRGRYRELG